eukprot:TRINITY_DN33112_c0_g1_i1.p2 TRINITY_DN33112_c0_g1~~TRINITY_DN33112_c0_g1_i1.p2  ORF type:complete len:283 (+),score=98.05 TRINITY_DN33112_c0_g1_i1:76-924(+)
MAKHRKDRKRAAKAVREGRTPEPPPKPGKMLPRKKGRKNSQVKPNLRGKARKPRKVRPKDAGGEGTVQISRKLAARAIHKQIREGNVAEEEEEEVDDGPARRAPGNKPRATSSAAPSRTLVWKVHADAGGATLSVPLKGSAPRDVKVLPMPGGVRVTHRRGAVEAPFPEEAAGDASAVSAQWVDGVLLLTIPVRQGTKRSASLGVETAAAPPKKRKSKSLVVDRDQARAIIDGVSAVQAPQQYDKVPEQDLWQQRQEVKARRRRQEKLDRHYKEKERRRAAQ